MFFSKILRLIANAGLIAFTSLLCADQEYFVGPAGDDTNDGRSPATALASIQAGVNMLKPGETLTILPGEYFESVRAKGLGSESAETVIRAAIPHTAILRGAAAAPEFEPVDGLRFVYRAPWTTLPVTVLEVDTLTELQRSFSPIELEFIAAAWYFDEDAQMLYISSSDLSPPEAHLYRIAEARQSGLYLDKSTRVRVEGLVATGYYPEDNRTHSFSRHVSGIMINDSVDCTIANCITYMNGNGICVVRGSGNLVEGNETYGNYTTFHSPSANIAVFEPNNTTARNNIVHTTRVGNGAGIKFYSNFHGPGLIEENIIWGSMGTDIWTKGNEAQQYGLARRNVVLGDYAVHNVDHNVMGGRNQYRRDNPHPTTLIIHPSVDRDAQFADPSHLDFRLQSTSEFRGADGSDQSGPFPFTEEVFFVGPEGSNENDGLAVSTAWRTLDYAVQQLKPGQTLYLLTGSYELNVPLAGLAKADAATRIRARGDGTVTITTPVRISDAHNLSLSRLTFTAGVTIADSSGISVENCVFEGNSGGLTFVSGNGLRLLHNEFRCGDAAITFRGSASEDAFLAGNLFDAPCTAAFAFDGPSADSIVYSDFNGFSIPVAATIGNNPLSLQDWQKEFDTHSTVLPLPGKDQSLRKHLLLAGPWGQPIGRYSLFTPDVARLVGPFVHSVSDRSANLEWFVSTPAMSRVSWGRRDSSEQHTRDLYIRNFGALTITGLEPGVEYWFRVDEVDPGANHVAHDNFYLTDLERIPLAPQGIRPEAAISFTTLTEALPARAIFVSPDGKDSNDGLSPETAWRTLNHAASNLRPGDTVNLLDGIWQETTFMRVGGEPGKRITWQAAPGAKVLLSGLKRNLMNGMVFIGKTDTTVDSLYFRDFGTGGAYSGMVFLRDSDNITLSRCFFDGRGPGYSPRGFVAASCDDLTISNCVVTSGFSGSSFFRCPNLRIENTVFLRNLIAAVVAVNKPGEKIYFTNNVVVDSLPIKSSARLFEIPEVDAFVQTNNGFYLRQPDIDRPNAFYFYRSAGKMTPAEYFAQFGARGSVVGDPRFAGMAGQEFEPDSFPPDRFVNQPDLDFPLLFVTNPEWVGKRIGLVPEAFEGFHFNK